MPRGTALVAAGQRGSTEELFFLVRGGCRAERTIQLRCMVSAANASDAWDLRCAVRERMIAWLQELEGGRYLPVLRVEGEAADARRSA